MKSCFPLFLFSLLSLVFSSCAFKSVTRTKDIQYVGPNPASGQPEQRLNIFAPRNHKKPKDVLIFFYGGNWNSGKKSLYNFFGNRLARKDIVAVIVDYPKSPGAGYNEMAEDAAKAVVWVKKHIGEYGGNSNRIFLSGHSAGGHLAALITIKPAYFEALETPNPVKGLILIDAAALDQYTYLKSAHLPPGHTYMKTFSTNPEVWKQASPVYYVHAGLPPMLIYVGGKTYGSITDGNQKLLTVLKPFSPVAEFHLLKHKRHIPMITQFLISWNPRYGEILRFMAGVEASPKD